MNAKLFLMLSGLLGLVAIVCTMLASEPAKNQHELADVLKINPHIRANILYATDQNFTKKAVYPKSARVYLLRHVASALDKVQKELELEGLGLLLWDGYRPLPVQEIFWEICPNENYVGNPKKGSVHNRGAAIDCTLIHLKTGEQLTMPTGFDDFTEKAWRKAGEADGLTKEQIANRQKLAAIMHKHGFKGVASEWWHFDWVEAAEHPERYPILKVTFEELQKKSN